MATNRAMRLAMRARRITFIHARAWTRKLVRTRTCVARDVQTGPIVYPVDQAVAKHRIRSRDAVRQRDRVADLARRVRIRNVDDANAVAVPAVEDQVLEHGWIVILLRDVAAALTIRLGVGLIEAVFESIVRNRE